MNEKIVKLMKKHYTNEMYYSAQNIFKIGADYNNLLSARNDGKSFQIKHYCLLDALINEKKMIYIRRYAVEQKIAMVESYFGDVDIPKMSKITGVEFDAIKCTAGEIIAVKYETERAVEVKKIGRYTNLASSGHIKSNTFVDYENLIYEEYVTEQGYLFDEPRRLQDVVSTVFRDRKGVVFLMGNILIRLNPYLREWGISDVRKMPEGEIRTYERDGVKIAVEHCANTAKKRGAKMFYGKARDNIVEGQYLTQVYPHLPIMFKKVNDLYTVDLEHENMFYTIRLIQFPEGMFYAFIHPTEKMKSVRRVTKRYTSDPMFTPTLTEVTNGDKILLILLKRNDIFYADNLTGTEFNQIRSKYGM